jgi:hypothetical protein
MSRNVDWYQVLLREAAIIEKRLCVLLVIDRVAIDEIDEMSEKTLSSFNQTKPSVAKVAGNVVFWIKKLKPISRAADSENDYRLINELVAVLVGVGICNSQYGGTAHAVNMTAQTLNDLVASLRYHSYSPNSVAMIFESLMQ